MLRPLIQPRLKQVLAQSISPRLSVLATGGLKRGQAPAIVFYAPLSSNTEDMQGAVDTFARASDGLYLDSGGIWQVAGTNVARFENGRILMEPASENVFLNSGAAVTQSISLPLGDHTLSVRGSGSVVSSDNGGTATGHGTATDGFPVTIDVTAAGLILFTVSGSPDYVQVEPLRTFTSPIITQGVSAPRAADALNWTDLTSFFNQTQGMALIDAQWTQVTDTNAGLSYRDNIIALIANESSLLSYLHTAANFNRFQNHQTTGNDPSVSFNFSSEGRYLGVVRWSTSLTELQIGLYDYQVPGWIWASATAYGGSFDISTVLNLAYIRSMPWTFKDLVIYDEDRGVSWIEANYP